MSPNDIEVLIHHHCTPDVHPRADAGAVKEAIQKFVADGIFESRPDLPSGYTTTAKGTAWMEMILGTPYPEMRWIDPRASESAMQARDDRPYVFLTEMRTREEVEEMYPGAEVKSVW